MKLVSKKNLLVLPLALSVSWVSPIFTNLAFAESTNNEVSQKAENQENAERGKFSERIQKIIDDYYKEQEAKEKAGSCCCGCANSKRQAT